MLKDANLQKTWHGPGRRTQEFVFAVVMKHPNLSLIRPGGKAPPLPAS